MDGYGVFMTKRQLDEAVAGTMNSPTKLIRNLLSVFFNRETLAGCSAFGSRKNPPLDGDIISACIRKLLTVYTAIHVQLYWYNYMSNIE